MSDFSLPPLISEFREGAVIWRKIEAIEFDTLGHLLCCHLVIEHYLDHYLAIGPGRKLAWGQVKLTFSQKLALLGEHEFPEPYNLAPLIKHLNGLRNRFSHDINFRLSEKDVMPIRRFLAFCAKRSGVVEDAEADPKQVLSTFTLIACAYLGAGISVEARKP